MRRPHVLLAGLVVAIAGGVCAQGEAAQSPSVTTSLRWSEAPMVRTAQVNGRLEGTVTDERGAPLAGVAVTAHGGQLQFAVTDRQGHFVFRSLPPGPYFVRAHLPGFVASQRELVEVRASSASTRQIRLDRVGEAAAVPSRPILAAAALVELPSSDDTSTPGVENGDSAESTEHDDSATAWRVRHVKRSVLRETDHAAGDTTEAAPAEAGTHALSFLSELPFTGQVQLLTTSSFDSADELFTGRRLPHGVAYVAITAPQGSKAHWAVQGALSDGDVSSWVLGGSYAAAITRAHVLDAGVSYAAQRYDGPNPLLVVAMGETSRTVGAMHAFDRWTVAPAMSVTVGARYARYGYLDQPGLFSPSLEWRWKVTRHGAVRALVTQRMLAPGAEEFVPSPVAAVWMPPQRTFSPLSPSGEFRAERARHLEVAFEREFGSFVLEASGFRQAVGDQIVTVFGLKLDDRPRADLSHYYTGTVGHVDASGWSVGISRPMASRVRGSVAYTQTIADWSDPDAVLLTEVTRVAGRPVRERIHDVTAAVETDVPETATRVYAAYKVNSGYASGESLEMGPAFSGRFDVQVNQRLPFVPLGDSQWEVLVAVRNLFHEAAEGASVYDELLVVRPPKRIVGGLLVRF